MKSKLIIILLVIINIMFLNINEVQAETLSDVIQGGDSFLQSGESGAKKLDEGKLSKTSKELFNILLILGMCIAVIISGILGIKFMIGSAEEKAEIKDALIPFVIGCIVVFGAFGIWEIFVTIGNNLSK